jgi:hypothetical protein
MKRQRSPAAASAFVGLLAVSAFACGGAVPPSSPLASLSDVTPAQWRALAERRVFFGHQSVGANVMAGVAEILAANPQIRLTVHESKDVNAGSEPAIYHANVGRNFYPLEKSDEFAEIAARALAPGDVGMVKYCFVDVEREVDPDSLFLAYRTRIADLRRQNPGLTVVHFTMPLTTVETEAGYWKNRLLGRVTFRDLNVARNRYNELLLQTYGGQEPVFDIAALESRRPDGSRAYFRKGGKTVYAMAEESTSDGGHLNEGARRMVAEQFLIFLARLPRERVAGPAGSGTSPS